MSKSKLPPISLLFSNIFASSSISLKSFKYFSYFITTSLSEFSSILVTSVYVILFVTFITALNISEDITFPLLSISISIDKVNLS